MRPQTPSTRLLLLGVILLGMAVAAWGASCVQQFVLGYDGLQWSSYLIAVDGELSVMWRRSIRSDHEAAGWVNHPDVPQTDRMSTLFERSQLYRGKTTSVFGFGYLSTRYDSASAGNTLDRAVWIPLWFPCILIATAVALAYRRWFRQRHRRVHGLCPSCGYDLRASPTQCPECGGADAANAKT